MLNTVKIFFSLLLGLTIPFSSNLMANNFVTLKDGRKFPISINIRGGFIKSKNFHTSLRNKTAMFIDELSVCSIEKITLECGNTVHKLEKLKPGYYLRDGEELIYKELAEEDL